MVFRFLTPMGLIASALLVSLCALAGGPVPTIASASLPMHERFNRPSVDPSFDLNVMGKTYLAESKSFKSSCLASSDVVPLPTTTEFPKLVSVQPKEFGELIETLGFTRKELSRYDLSTATAASEFARTLLLHEASVGYTYQLALPTETIVLRSMDLSPAAREFLAMKKKAGRQKKTRKVRAQVSPPAEGAIDVKKEFFTTCGDEFVDHMELGGKLWVSVRFELRNGTEKEIISRTLNPQFTLGQLSQTLTYAQTAYEWNVALRVSVFQWGGNILALQTVLNQQGIQLTRNSDVAGGATISCSHAQFLACQKLIQALTQYASDTPNANGFIAQSDPSSLVPLSMSTRDWASLGIRLVKEKPKKKKKEPIAVAPPEAVVPATLTAEELDAAMTARGATADLYTQYVKYLARISAMTSAFPMSKEQQQTLARLEKNFQIARDYIPSAMSECFKNPGVCVEFSQAIQQNLNKFNVDLGFDPAQLTIVPTGFRWACEDVIHSNRRGSLFPSGITREAAKTILYLTEVVRKRLDIPVARWSGMENRCAVVDFHLSHIASSLDLDGVDLTDLSPVFMLSGLRFLSLTGMHIRNISQIGQMKSLVWLDISDNDIRDISAMSGLKELQALDLSRNPVGDVRALENLDKLTALRIPADRGRHFPCPIKKGICQAGN